MNPSRLGWLLALAHGLLATPGPAAAAPSRCLPPEAGARLAGLLEGPLVHALLPPGLRYRDASVEGRGIAVFLEQTTGTTGTVVFSERPDPPAEGAGRWFRWRTEPAGQEVGLLPWAVEQAFPHDPWIECGARSPAVESDGASAAPQPPGRLRYPRWMYLGFGWLGFALLLGAALRALWPGE